MTPGKFSLKKGGNSRPPPRSPGCLSDIRPSTGDQEAQVPYTQLGEFIFHFANSFCSCQLQCPVKWWMGISKSKTANLKPKPAHVKQETPPRNYTPERMVIIRGLFVTYFQVRHVWKTHSTFLAHTLFKIMAIKMYI